MVGRTYDSGPEVSELVFHRMEWFFLIYFWKLSLGSKFYRRSCRLRCDKTRKTAVWSRQCEQLFSRVAILIVGYHDCLVGSSELSGLSALFVRLLESHQYKTLIIRHDDLKPQHKKIDRIKILEQKLRTLLAPSSQ